MLRRARSAPGSRGVGGGPQLGPEPGAVLPPDPTGCNQLLQQDGRCVLVGGERLVQPFLHRKAHVEPNGVHQGVWTHRISEPLLDDVVDGLKVHGFTRQQGNGAAQVRHQQVVDDEATPVRRSNHGLAHTTAHGTGCQLNCVAGLWCPDQLHQPHDRCGVEKVQSEHHGRPTGGARACLDGQA